MMMMVVVVLTMVMVTVMMMTRPGLAECAERLNTADLAECAERLNTDPLSEKCGSTRCTSLKLGLKLKTKCQPVRELTFVSALGSHASTPTPRLVQMESMAH